MLGETVFRSGDLPAQDRLAALDELWVNSAHPMRVVSDAPERFRATVRTVDIGAVNVAGLALSPSEVQRTPKLIRQADPELCSAIVPLSGSLVVSQAGRDMTLGAREIALYDSSRPFRIRFTGQGGATRLVRAHIPRALLALPAHGLERLLARPLPAGAGFEALLSRLLADVTSPSTAYRPHDLPRLGVLAQDLLTSVVAHHLEADGATPDDSRRRTLLLSIETFVRQHLGDPELSPETVAAAHHISIGHLHRLFRTRETTVAAWIRHQRLECARRDLTDPALHGVPIHLIATRWGFKDHPTFTRAFRSAYGASPKDYRRTPGTVPQRQETRRSVLRRPPVATP
ncbi:helix-turn-helix domain-containing protein [Streptomyces sp. FXJ1.172]|uniref:helix-turn-helix domain-containing protein n=1 Tax=Streptomyces sp. FXJ1.172 TaxID=710705 RepID=UPI00082ACC99|nr:helix-turn-helix domain-containing protein [Streptomyces sp. FXJ1.172]WEO99545.1 helix-turn-helix domain-containing protein [Streptomyces sp. FXJ1.172]